jgi:O-antigen/teichoic acid export membrane protein
VAASVELLRAAMAAGSLAGILLALVLLPAAENVLVSMRGNAFREIAAFAWWRSAQAGVRPTALLLARIMIAAVASKAVLGAVEAARLLLAPALTFVNGSGWFLLGDYAKAEREQRPLRARSAIRACAAMSGITLLLSLGGILLAGPLGPVITNHAFRVDHVALVGWGVYAVSFACTLPLASLATARRQSRLVFIVRGAESLIGLSALGLLLIARPGWAAYAPYCLGSGGVISAGLLWIRLRRGDPVSTPGAVRMPAAAS